MEAIGNNEEHVLRGHYIICNWSDKADTVIRELHSPVIHHKPPIVVITDQPERMPTSSDPAYDAVFTVVGDPTDPSVLRRAGILTADTAIILADEREGKFADTKSVLIALAIEAIQPRVYTVVELLDSRNESQFQHTHVDEIVCVDTLAEKLLAQASLVHGVSQVYLHLLTASKDTNEIYFVPVPKAFVGAKYRDLEQALLDFREEDIVLIGVATKREKLKSNGNVVRNSYGKVVYENVVTINPPSRAPSGQGDVVTADYELKDHDRLIVIAYEEPTKLSELRREK